MSREQTRSRRVCGDEGRDVVHRLFERVYSKGDLGLVDELVATDCRGYSPESAGAYLGSQGMKTHVVRLRRAFHGFTVEIDALDVASDVVEVQWTARGTHERPFLGVEPTCNVGPAGEEPHGNRIAVSGTARGILTNDGIHEWVMEWDLETLRSQLGAPERRSTGDEDRDEAHLPT